ncbi:MAG: Fic family protein [Candidatus Kariarchaeaceae archaeon]|jgi:Fic family protein
MVYLKKLKKKNRFYYSLEHSFRKDGKIQKLRKNLGPEIPSNLEELKSQFFREIYEEIWFINLDLIQENFFEDIRNLPQIEIKKRMENFGIRFTYNSNRIEGSSLKLRDTQLLLGDNISPPNKPMKHIIEARAHQKVFYDILEYDGHLHDDIVLKWHYDLLNETEIEIAGVFRVHPVEIKYSSVTPPHHHDLPELLSDFFDWVQTNIDTLSLHPVELAALVHQKFVTIHPFSDGNGRISRFMQNYILNKFNFPMLIIDYKVRRSYYNALERSNLKDDPYIFVQWFFRVYLKAYDRFLKVKSSE